MWIQTEDKEKLMNVNQYISIGIQAVNKDGEQRWAVGTIGSFSFNTFKSFKYKEDAVTYLGQLLEKLNDEN